MAVSAGGLITFLALVVVGPVCLLVYEWLAKKRKAARGDQDDAPTTDQDGREVVTNVEYMLGLLGYAIGIGNLWRFPFLCGRNGGAAFLVAYFTCLLLVSLPAYMIEMVMGQYTRKSTIACFNMVHPIWRGVGWAQAFMLFWVIAYYNVLLGYACIYVIGSLSDPMPWEPETAGLGGTASATYWNEDVLNRFPAEEQGPNGLGPLSWKTSIALLAVWLIVFFSIAFGKKVLAKVTWVTVVGPVLMLIILLFRVAFLNASDEGVAFYIGKFDGSKLGEIQVWRDACVQILFSLSPGMGTAITMSSFTKPKENVYKTCLIVAFCNSAFSFVGGFAIFSIVGNITYKINYQTLSDLIESTKITAASFAQRFGTDVVSKAQAALAALPASAQVATAAAKQRFEQDVQGALRMLNETAFSSVLMGRQIPNVDMTDFTVTTSQASAANDLSEYTSLANYIKSLGDASVAAAATASTALLGIVLSEEQYHNNGQLELAASTTRDAIGQLLAVANTQALHDRAMLETGTNLTLADETGMLQSIAETARAGPGLAFIAIADGMQTFGSFKNVMAVLFFMTLLTLGLDSTFAWAEILLLCRNRKQLWHPCQEGWLPPTTSSLLLTNVQAPRLRMESRLAVTPCPSARLGGASRVGLAAVAAAACLVVFGAAGVKLAASSGQAVGDSLRGQPVEATAPEVMARERVPQSASRFLASEELMAVVAEHSVRNNRFCHSIGLQDAPAICNATALTPFLVKHMSKRVQAMPNIIAEKMASLEIGGKSQEAVLFGTPHVADPQLPTIAKEAVHAWGEASRSAPEVAMRRLTEKLKPCSSQLTDLRAKLFPNAPDVDPSVASQHLQTVLSARGLYIQHEADKRNPWNVSVDMAMPQGRGLTSALRSMPSGRELAPALFAPGTAPLPLAAPKSGPPPPDDLAGDICASLMLPLSHLVMACLHSEGKLTLPYWAKVVITVEDVLTLGATGFLPIIALIVDLTLMWTPRGYTYPEGAENMYPQSFLNPNTPTPSRVSASAA